MGGRMAFHDRDIPACILARLWQEKPWIRPWKGVPDGAEGSLLHTAKVCQSALTGRVSGDGRCEMACPSAQHAVLHGRMHPVLRLFPFPPQSFSVHQGRAFTWKEDAPGMMGDVAVSLRFSWHIFR